MTRMMRKTLAQHSVSWDPYMKQWGKSYLAVWGVHEHPEDIQLWLPF